MRLTHEVIQSRRNMALYYFFLKIKEQDYSSALFQCNKKSSNFYYSSILLLISLLKITSTTITMPLLIIFLLAKPIFQQEKLQSIKTFR